MKTGSPYGLNRSFISLPAFYTSFIGKGGRNVKSLTLLQLLPVQKNLKVEARII